MSYAAHRWKIVVLCLLATMAGLLMLFGGVQMALLNQCPWLYVREDGETQEEALGLWNIVENYEESTDLYELYYIILGMRIALIAAICSSWGIFLMHFFIRSRDIRKATASSCTAFHISAVLFSLMAWMLFIILPVFYQWYYVPRMEASTTLEAVHGAWFWQTFGPAYFISYGAGLVMFVVFVLTLTQWEQYKKWSYEVYEMSVYF